MCELSNLDKRLIFYQDWYAPVLWTRIACVKESFDDSLYNKRSCISRWGVTRKTALGPLNGLEVGVRKASVKFLPCWQFKGSAR